MQAHVSCSAEAQTPNFDISRHDPLPYTLLLGSYIARTGWRPSICIPVARTVFAQEKSKSRVTADSLSDSRFTGSTRSALLMQ